MEEPTEFCDNPTCLGEPWCSAWEICSEMMDRAATAVPEEEKIYSNSIIKEPKERDSQASCSNLPQTTTGQSFSPSKKQSQASSPLSFGNKRLFAAKKLMRKLTGQGKLVCKKTKEDTKYCCGLWTSWSFYRENQNGDNGPIESLSRENIQYWLTRFILEVKVIM